MSSLGQNISNKLHQRAGEMPTRMAIAEPAGRARDGKRRYRQMSFRELDEDSSRLAEGLVELGARPGQRLVLMVRPGIDFISLTFAMFKAGVVVVLIDPGMGRGSLIRCLEEVDAEGFVAIPLVHALRTILHRKFRRAKLNVTVGRRWFWGGVSLRQLRARSLGSVQMARVTADDPAAIIFTTGSTGPPKGVLYRHGNFAHQADQIQQFYNIQPGGIDLPGFPLFALFNCAMGMSTVIPDMDPTRPAKVDPMNIIEAIRDWNVTQAFGSPALWNVVGRYCEEKGVRLPTLERILSAGAPVPPHVLKRMQLAIREDGDVHTPYGATEALPVASIAATTVLAETAERTASGRGTCVGQRFPGIQWKVIRIRDDAIHDLAQIDEMPVGDIGELIVQGPVVTREYVTRTDANALHKIRDGDTFWHRMGDTGYFDDQERFWFCGRKSQRVLTQSGPMYTVMCEAIFNEHPSVYRTALVGLGDPGNQMPVLIVEPLPGHVPKRKHDRQHLFEELRELAKQHRHTEQIERFIVRHALPVDIRHNAKISREKLTIWAANHSSMPGVQTSTDVQVKTDAQSKTDAQ